MKASALDEKNSTRGDDSPGELAAWLESLRAVPDMHVERIPFGQCAPWVLDGNVIVRPDGRFFALSSSEEGSVIIEQSEVGLLAFVLLAGSGAPRIVVHAKDEPGNLYVTQLSPTIQATRSNFERVHGGRRTPMLEDLFSCGEILSDTLQSEHSSHFWRKRNRNVAVVLPSTYVELDKRLRVFPVQELLSLCLTDQAVNTDARSVLVTTPWSALTGSEPFCRRSDHFGRLLRDSFLASTEDETPMKFLAGHRGARDPKDVPRHPRQLTAQSMVWGVSDQAHFIAVRSGTREVETWKQPILVPAADDLQVLVCRHGAAGLEFLLRVERSEALFSSAEFAATFSRVSNVPWSDEVGETIAALHQTDEGGRFWQAVCRYEIRLLTEGDRGDALAQAVQPACWVTLRQLQNLTARELTTTNELRTLVSMLLYWL
jgi:oxidase EvaA